MEASGGLFRAEGGSLPLPHAGPYRPRSYPASDSALSPYAASVPDSAYGVRRPVAQIQRSLIAEIHCVQATARAGRWQTQNTRWSTMDI
eukprot:508451-Rhodomonas_salina.4